LLHHFGRLSLTRCRIIQYHYKTRTPFIACVITVTGWWTWCLLLSAVYGKTPGPYSAYHGFTEHFGRDWNWWLTLVVTLLACFVLVIVIDIVGRLWWSGDVERWQEREQMVGVKEWMRKKGGEGGYGIVDWDGFGEQKGQNG
jgi:phospholipid-translocating ATPase